MPGLSSIFGGQDVDFSKAQGYYQQGMDQAMAAIKAAEAQGRTDIADSLRKSMGLNQPYIGAGTTAMNSWMNSLGIGDQGGRGQSSLMNQFQQSPGYQYAVQQATNAAQRRAAASGQGMSGAELREITAQTQGQAGQDWNNWLNNYQSQLSSIAGRGQQSAMQQAGFENQGGANLANLGLNYNKMSVDEINQMAKAQAEAEMAQQTQNAQSSNNWLSSMGSLLGGAAGFMFGQPELTGSTGAMNWLSNLFGQNKSAPTNSYLNQSNWKSQANPQQYLNIYG